MSHPVQATELEQRLLPIWREVLGVEAVGVHDNFFDLDGGDSLGAMLVFTRMNEALGIALPPRALFEAPTVAKLSALIRRDFQREHGPPVPPVRRRSLPVSLQQASWFEREQRGPVDLVPAGGLADPARPGVLYGFIRINGPVDCDSLRSAFEEVVRRHESLRTSFAHVDGELRQTFSVVPRIDFEVTAAAADSLDGSVTRALLKPLDYTSGCLLRVTVLSLGPRKHLIVPAIARIAGDDWTMHLIIREAMTFYRADATARRTVLAEPSLQYTDYVSWQREWLGGDAQRDIRKYFETSIQGLPELRLPYDCPVGRERTYIGGVREFQLPERLAAAVGELAERESTSPYLVLLTSFLALLREWTGQRDLSVTTWFSGRQRPEMHGLAGFVACEAIVRVRLGDAHTFVQMLSEVKQVMRQTEHFEGVPLMEFEQLASKSGQPLPAFPVSVHGPSFAASNALPEFPDMDFDAAPGMAPDTSVALPAIRNDIEFKVRARARETVTVILLYAVDVFFAETAAMLEDKFLRILEAGVAESGLSR